MKKTINWALTGTGGITNRFLTGLRAAEGSFVSAVVSRTKENAEKFAAQYGIEKSYSSYDLMLEDPAIDAVYIGTPHTTHRDLAVRALNAKKAVLCEKPAAINAREVSEMIGAARDNKTFFMEAMWNRFTPPFVKVRQWLKEGLIGEVKLVQANLGFNSAFDPRSRLFDPGQGGGALLDLGIYPLSLGSMVFGAEKPESIASRLIFNEAGSDNEAAVILSYSKDRICQFTANLSLLMVNDAWIYGTGGSIHIPSHTFAHKAALSAEPRYTYLYEPDYISNGYNYEAEAVMDCLREGLVECPVMPWAESLLLAETMDAIRAQWNFKYPMEK